MSDTSQTKRSLAVIAAEITADWKNVYFGAVPYIKAMRTMRDAEQTHFGHDSTEDIVNRFLCNASHWRGETARRIKAELKTTYIKKA